VPTGGALVVEGLERRRVPFVFGIPAVHNLPIYDALRASKHVRSVSVKHEQAAGFMAIGYAYSTGKPATCVVGCGPGATNMLTPVGEAYLDSAPMLVIAGGIRTTSARKGGLHDIDQLSMFAPITKDARRLTNAGSLDASVEQAIEASASGRPRPVFLEIPFDVLSREVHTERAEASPATSPSKKSGAPEAVSLAAKALSRASRPLIIAGGGINNAEAWGELANLAELLHSPVTSTISAKGAYPEDLPLSAGQLWDSVGLRAASEADVVLAVGCRFSERSTASWGLRFSGSLIQVDIDPDEIGRNYPAALGISADGKEFLRAVSAEINPETSRERTGWAHEIQRARLERSVQVEENLPSDGSIEPRAAVHEIADALPEDAVVVAETGHAFWWPALMFQTKMPRSFLSPSGNSTLGFGFPAALGAKCARPERPVVCLAGDGGFTFTCQEIATSVEERIPVVTVIFDDGGYAAIREYQRKGYGSRYIGVDFSIRPDFVKLAESLGADGVRVERLEDIGPALKGALRASRTMVIDIEIGREEDVLPKFFTEIYRQR
jgi:acetolactate synthase I/II/III large subunit